MTVAGLLDESLMSGAHVLTGADRLDQQVHWVLPLSEVMSRHDALDGVAVYTRPEALLGNGGTLAPLAARGATALLVDGTVPADFPTAAVPADMVVVEMAFPVGFAALNRLLAERALSQEVHAMRYATHVHASLAGLFHRGAGLQLLVREVSNLARNPAMALDARGNVVAHNGFTAETAAALTESILPLLTADLPAAARLSAHHDTRVERFGAPGGGVWTVISTAIRLGKAFEGWVLVVVPSAEPGGHDLARHIVVTEQATAIIGSEMLRQHSVDEAEERAAAISSRRWCTGTSPASTTCGPAPTTTRSTSTRCSACSSHRAPSPAEWTTPPRAWSGWRGTRRTWHPIPRCAPM